MSDKDKIQAAIDALEALEGLPIAHDVERALYDLRLELNCINNRSPLSSWSSSNLNTTPYACISCGTKHTNRITVENMISRGGHCKACWMVSAQ